MKKIISFVTAVMIVVSFTANVMAVNFDRTPITKNEYDSMNTKKTSNNSTVSLADGITLVASSTDGWSIQTDPDLTGTITIGYKSDSDYYSVTIDLDAKDYTGSFIIGAGNSINSIAVGTNNTTRTNVTTEPVVTEPPVTEPPVTEPPVTEPPVTEPPVTEPPAAPTPANTTPTNYITPTPNNTPVVTFEDTQVPLADAAPVVTVTSDDSVIISSSDDTVSFDDTPVPLGDFNDDDFDFDDIEIPLSDSDNTLPKTGNSVIPVASAVLLSIASAVGMIKSKKHHS